MASCILISISSPNNYKYTYLTVYLCTDLDPGLGEVQSHGELLSGEHVGVLSLLECSLKVIRYYFFIAKIYSNICSHSFRFALHNQGEGPY